MLPQSETDPKDWHYDSELGRIADRLDGVEAVMSELTRQHEAVAGILAELFTKLAGFEQRAEPLLRKAEQRGRLFGGAKSQNPMDRGV